jgi:hypothetical protein
MTDAAGEPLADDEWRLMLQLLQRAASHEPFQQWEQFSLPLPGTNNRLYVHYGLRPPHGDAYEHLYPLVDPATGRQVE